MPAKPRRLPPLRDEPDVRLAVVRWGEEDRERLAVDRARDDFRAEPERALVRERVDRGLLDVLLRLLLRDLEVLELLELEDRRVVERPDDFLPRCALVSPFSRRILLTVRAATSSARPP